MFRYLKMDICRMLTSWQFYAGILGIGFLYLLAGSQIQGAPDVYMSYFYNGFFSTAILAYAFCAVPFSGCLMEDAQNGYWLPAVQRGGVKDYVCSKVLVCFLSGIVTMVLGILLFVCLLRTRLPFLVENANVAAMRQADTFGFLLYPDTILLYFICSSAVSGMLGGIFAVISAWLSLYERYRIFSICVPVIGFYFLENLMMGNLKLPDCFSIWVIYGACSSVFGNTSADLICAFLVAAVFLIMAGGRIQKKVKEDVCEYYGEPKYFP